MIRVLFCGERDTDWMVLQACAHGSGASNLHLSWESSLDRARATLCRGDHDVYVIDEDLGSGQGIELLSEELATGRPLMAILLTSTDNLTEQAMAIRAGATDVLCRDELSPQRLRRAVIHATARAAFSDHIQRNADPGLISQASLRNRLDRALSRERLSRAGVALLQISVRPGDGREGLVDALTAATAERILTCLGDADSTTLVGPGRFQVLLEDLAHGALAAVVADRVVSALSAPLSVRGGEIKPVVSVGISVAPEDTDHAPELFQRSETALREADRSGGQTFRFESAPMNEKAQRRWRLLRALDGALERGEFSLHYQPQVSTQGERLTGAEALIRWQSPHLGWVSPAEFIPLLEGTSKILEVGQWVLEQASAQARRWELQGMRIRIGVNASARQLTGTNFGDAVAEVLRSTRLAPNLLGIEITEGLLLEGSQVVRDTLQGLRRRGVSISVDDFGTGYASLSYIKKFPMDVIKIDREFVRGVPIDIENAAITSAIIALGNSLRLKTLAEGVETEAELEFLRSLGCTEVQGYYFAKPMPPAAFEEWAREHPTGASSEPRPPRIWSPDID
jgi:EAL domain-containing protein (putative c-di-GMP-specific phosphodiesterase class I)/GGDEF domain-containing protein